MYIKTIKIFYIYIYIYIIFKKIKICYYILMSNVKKKRGSRPSYKST